MWKSAPILILIALLLLPGDSEAQVQVSRQGEENPVLTVSKSIVYGGLAGLVLGGAVALAAQENEGEIMRWSFVAGTFVGFGAGVWHVTHRAQPSAAMLHFAPDGVHAALPAAEIYEAGGGGGIRVALLSFTE